MQNWQEKPAKEVKVGDFLNWADRPVEVTKVVHHMGKVYLTVDNLEDGLQSFSYDPDLLLQVRK